MSISKVLKRLQKLHPKYIDLNLIRMFRLLKELGNPHKLLPPIIHVAGTNGKGSTIAFLRSILEFGGLKTHTYTSPHLINFSERIRICGKLISNKELEELLEEVETINNGQEITFFEITTAAAFLIFSRVQADVLLLEVGLGGRLDATNVIDNNILASIITSISYDHENFLGRNIDKIAYEKSGIIKKSTPIISSKQTKRVEKVIREVSLKLNSPLYIIGKSIVRKKTPSGTINIKINNQKISFEIPQLLGEYQKENAILAASCIAICKESLPKFNFINSLEGITKTIWPARLQVLKTGPLIKLINNNFKNFVILDGAHNYDGIINLVKTLKQINRNNWQIIFGSIRSRHPGNIINALKPISYSIITIKIPEQKNSYTSDELFKIVSKYGVHCISALSLNYALKEVSKKNLPVCICGSLYLAGYFLKLNKEKIN